MIRWQAALTVYQKVVKQKTALEKAVC